MNLLNAIKLALFFSKKNKHAIILYNKDCNAYYLYIKCPLELKIRENSIYIACFYNSKRKHNFVSQ